MENTKLLALNKIKEQVVGAVHIIQGHVRKDGLRMQAETKKDLELSVEILNYVITELNEEIRS